MMKYLETYEILCYGFQVKEKQDNNEQEVQKENGIEWTPKL